MNKPIFFFVYQFICLSVCPSHYQNEIGLNSFAWNFYHMKNIKFRPKFDVLGYIVIKGQQDEWEEVEWSHFGADQQRGRHDCGPLDD